MVVIVVVSYEVLNTLYRRDCYYYLVYAGEYEEAQSGSNILPKVTHHASSGKPSSLDPHAFFLHCDIYMHKTCHCTICQYKLRVVNSV